MSMFKKAGDRTLAKARVKKTKSEIIGMQRAMAVKKRVKANRIALLKRCYAALHKPPAERTEKEIMMLVDFTTTNKFFTDKFERIGDPYHRELCRRMQHRVYRLDGYIIRQGEIGDEFYIIMTGTVRVQLEPEDEGDDPKTLVTLGPGDSFGELALLNEKPRAASCVCSSMKGECMVIRKIDFKEILGKSHVATLQARAKWLRVVPLFRSLDPKTLLVVASHMSTRSYRRHEIIVKEGAHAGSMFLLVRGRCRVFKSDDNRLLELPGLVPGQMFGELGVILPGSTRTASVLAEDVNVRALELSSHDFFEHLGHMQDLLLDECLGAYPCKLDIGDRLKNHQRWEQYRRGLVRQLQEDAQWRVLAKSARHNAPGSLHPACQRGTPPLAAQNPEPCPPVHLLRTSAVASKEISKMQHEQKDAMPWRQAHHARRKREAQGGVAEQRRASHIDDKNMNQVRRLTRRASLQKQGAHGHGRGAETLQGAEYTHTLRHHAESRFRVRLNLRGTNRTVKVPIIASRTISLLGRHNKKSE
jgi:cAMP-dependent protein kinase regulator